MSEYLECGSCGERKPDVEWQVDPFMNEIYGDKDLYLLCDDCAFISAMDIYVMIALMKAQWTFK